MDDAVREALERLGGPRECGEVKHVGLRALDKRTREEIARFVKESKGKLTYEQMREVVARRWCVDLSVGQLARLAQPPRRKYAIPEDVARFLEEEFGDVYTGIKATISIVKAMGVDAPRELRAIAREIGGREYTWGELVEALRSLGYEDVNGIVRELARWRFLARQPNGKWRVYRLPMPDELFLLQFLAGFG